MSAGPIVSHVSRLLPLGICLGVALVGCTAPVSDTAPSFTGDVADQRYTVGEAIRRLVLPEAAGGDGALSYALTPAVPGLAFDGSTRMLSGTPTTAGTYEMTYRVTDADGDADSLSFSISVLEGDTAPSFQGGVPGQRYTVGETIRPLVLPEAAGGNGALSYALTPAVPGLTFDPSTRTLTGTPTTAGTYEMTYRVTDADGDADSLSFSITVLEGDTAPSFGDGVPDQSYTVGETIRPLVLPEAAGGNGALSYALTPAVPGLMFDGSTRTLTGTPTTAGTYEMTYRVTDADGDAGHLSFRITVHEPQSVVDTIVTSVAVGDAAGVFRRELLPASTGGPGIQVSGSTSVINGGAFFLDIVSDDGSNLKKLLVSIGAQTFGYYDITLSDSGELQAGTAAGKQAITKTAVYLDRDAARNSDSSYRLIGQVSQDLDLSSLCVAIVAVAQNGMIGAPACHDLKVVQVGTGDVQVSLSWDVDSDVDLHVVDPNGDEIYWDRQTVSSGGRLDLDSNADCRIDGVRNENVTWPTGSAPRGLYTVRVNYWDSCGVSQTDYVIRVNNGGLTSAFSGTLTGSGSRGGAGSGEVVTTFMVPPGAQPDTAPNFRGGVPDQSYTAGEAISPLVLPDAVGGDGALSYALQPAVPGLTFDRRTRTLSGTPTTPGTYAMTYRVADADGNTADRDADTLTFTITVRPAFEMSCTYSGNGDQVCSVNPDGRALDQVSYELRLGAARPEVYLIATNTNSSPASTTVQRLGAAAATEGQGPFADMGYPSPRMRTDSSGHAPPWIVEFNNNPPRLEGYGGRRQVQRSQAQRAVAEGDRFTFVSQRGSTNTAVPATVRRVVSAGSTTLAVWVADREWSATCRAPHQCMTREMVDAVAGRFLRPGAGNDIHDWVTDIFGAPWGPHDNSYLIPAESASQIHVLFLDIDGDGIPSEEWRTYGYFHGLHNYLRADDPAWLQASNERLMFFMDAPLMAQRDGPTWEITDYYPGSLISTLAHEFQHMIHFYQKSIRRRAVSEAWLNEMASEVTQDLVADKIEADGPRGVAHDDPTAGAGGNARGRLGRYNFYNHIQVTDWDSMDDTGKHYSINYALGAYLARNYGGAPLFGGIVGNGQSGVAAIETALRTQGHADSFGDVLANWAVANLLSDDPGAPSPYRYNSGASWSISRAGGETYRLGSINLYNHRYYHGSGANDYVDGPRLYGFQQFSDGIRRDPHSNAYTTLGRTTGTVGLRISSDSGMRIHVVVKE